MKHFAAFEQQQGYACAQVVTIATCCDRLSSRGEPDLSRAQLRSTRTSSITAMKRRDQFCVSLALTGAPAGAWQRARSAATAAVVLVAAPDTADGQRGTPGSMHSRSNRWRWRDLVCAAVAAARLEADAPCEPRLCGPRSRADERCMRITKSCTRRPDELRRGQTRAASAKSCKETTVSSSSSASVAATALQQPTQTYTGQPATTTQTPPHVTQ